MSLSSEGPSETGDELMSEANAAIRSGGPTSCRQRGDVRQGREPPGQRTATPRARAPSRPPQTRARSVFHQRSGLLSYPSAIETHRASVELPFSY